MQNVKIYLENNIILDAKTNNSKDFTVCGELVFITSMTGYQEIITDPSFAEQIIVMTYPLIGNYGVNTSWNQSQKIYAKAMIVQIIEDSGFEQFLNEESIPLIHSIDTRNLVHLIRENFYPKCVISTNEMPKAEHFSSINANVVPKISVTKPLEYIGFAQNNKTIGLVDFGVKQNIIEELKKYFAKIIVLPYNTNDFTNLDCILLSNGPGDPAILTEVITNIKNWLGKIDIYGICLGHQLLGLALNCETEIMSFGHRGANHPVMNLETGKIIITAQNHGYAIAKHTLPSDVKITHINLHDNSIEGIESAKYIAKSVQFHPESSPGPVDAKIIFEEWFSRYIL